MQLALFLIFGALAVAGAINFLLQKHPINSALSLVVVMISLAILYWSLGAEFLAAAQVIVYSGAVMVLFVFVIMLLNAGEEERTNFSKLATYAGVPLAVAIAGLIAAVILKSSGNLSTAGPNGALTSTKNLSMLLLREFVYPFELTSFLVLVAILGAIVLAQREN